MPIYRFRCSSCLKEEEVILPMADRNNTRLHSCGASMERLMSVPFVSVMRIYGRDEVLKTLNKEDGYDLPTRKSDRPRMERALAKGLDPPKRVIGRGF